VIRCPATCHVACHGRAEMTIADGNPIGTSNRPQAGHGYRRQPVSLSGSLT